MNQDDFDTMLTLGLDPMNETQQVLYLEWKGWGEVKQIVRETKQLIQQLINKEEVIPF